MPILEALMWTPEDRALVGDYGSGQALSDDQYRLIEPFIPPPKPGGRPRTTDMRQMLDGLFYVVRTGCQWRHLPLFRRGRQSMAISELSWKRGCGRPSATIWS
jgi:transposase